MRPAEAAAALPGYVQKEVEYVRTQIAARTYRAANELKNKAGHVLNNPEGSAPGQPPGAITHNLQREWDPQKVATAAVIISKMHYSGYLEYGTSKMAPRPYVDRIAQEAMPKIISIFQEIGG